MTEPQTAAGRALLAAREEMRIKYEAPSWAMLLEFAMSVDESILAIEAETAAQPQRCDFDCDACRAEDPDDLAAPAAEQTPEQFWADPTSRLRYSRPHSASTDLPASRQAAEVSVPAEPTPEIDVERLALALKQELNRPHRAGQYEEPDCCSPSDLAISVAAVSPTTYRRRCPTHNLHRSCPACDAERLPSGYWHQLEVRPGTAEWLLRAAKWYDSLGPISATEFAEAISCDLREVAA